MRSSRGDGRRDLLFRPGGNETEPCDYIMPPLPSFLSPCSLFQYVRRYFQFFFSLALNNTTLKERKQPKDISTFLFSLSLPVCLFIAWAIYSLMATGSASANKRALIGLISLLFCFVCLRSPYTRYAHSRQ